MNDDELSRAIEKMSEVLRKKIDKEMMGLMLGDTYTSTAKPTEASFERIKEVIGLIRRSNPFYVFMDEKGFNPDDGWVMALPGRLKERVCSAPSYVIFDKYIGDTIIFFNERTASEKLSIDKNYPFLVKS